MSREIRDPNGPIRRRPRGSTIIGRND